MQLRAAATWLALCVCGHAAAQPAPPDAGPPQAPAADAPVRDPVLEEQIAEHLVGRAQELFDAKIYVDAKQLAVEALVKSPKGNAAERARHIIRLVNQYLNIKEDPAPVPPSDVAPATAPGDQVDLSPISEPNATRPFDPSTDPPPAQPAAEGRDGRNAGTIHGALYGGVIGATIGAYIGGDNPASVAVPVGIAAGVGGGLLARPLVRRLRWDEAQIRTVGSMNLWGGMVGGLFAGAATGEGDGPPSSKGVLLGASIGSTVGLLGGAALARNQRLTRGDVALVDTFAGIGAVGGLTIGMLMQPAQPEAYAVNSLLGTVGGVALGLIAGPQTNTTPRRMLRVAGLAAAGGALPFLLYAAIYDDTTSGDERLVGALSSIGLVGGAYLGFRLTRGMDVGLDVHDGKPSSDDAPTALLGRHSDGSWSVGGIGFMPGSKVATSKRSLSLRLFGMTW